MPKDLERKGPLTLVFALAVALVIASCSTADEGNGSHSESLKQDGKGVPTESGLFGIAASDTEPQRGGSLTVAIYVEARSLDSAVAPSAGTTAGMETAAIYDVLIRYDSGSRNYEPWMAKSIDHSKDFQTWTLGLRQGVTFTDGTPLDAAAVVAHIKRCKGGRYAPLVNQIESMETPNNQTVVFNLVEPWSLFPYVLSSGPGRITSPTAVEKWGDEFGKHPVGAGPFILDNFNSGEEIALTANENYWGEGPYLENLRFVPREGAQAKLEELNSGGLQVALLRDAEVMGTAIKGGYGGFVNFINAGEILAINNAEGFAGADSRIRKAIAYAINIEQFGRRVYHGNGYAQKEIMAEASPWATDAEANAYDPEKAKALLKQARADGFDGKLTLSTDGTRTRQSEALSIQAQLNAVGFDVSLDTAPTAGALYGKILDRSYEIAFYGIVATDAAPWVKLVRELKSTSPTNRMSYSDPKMNDLLNTLHDATNEGGKKFALNEIQKRWAETVPSVPLAAVPEFVAWNDDVHGIVPTSFTTVLFSEAWLES